MVGRTSLKQALCQPSNVDPLMVLISQADSQETESVQIWEI